MTNTPRWNVVESGLQQKLRDKSTGLLFIGDSMSNWLRAASAIHTVRRKWPYSESIVRLHLTQGVSDVRAAYNLGLFNGFGGGIQTARRCNGALLTGSASTKAAFATGDKSLGMDAVQDEYSASSGALQIRNMKIWADADTTRRNYFELGTDLIYKFGWYHSSIGGQSPCPTIDYDTRLYVHSSGTLVAGSNSNNTNIAIDNAGGIDVHTITTGRSPSETQSVGIKMSAEFDAANQHAYLVNAVAELASEAGVNGAGLFYCGFGGCTLDAHLDDGDPDLDPAIDAVVRDELLGTHLDMWCWPGIIVINIYNGPQTWDDDVAETRRWVEKIIARYATAYVVAGRDIPTFVLTSPIHNEEVGSFVDVTVTKALESVYETVSKQGVTTAHTAPTTLDDPNNAGKYVTVPSHHIAFVNMRRLAELNQDLDADILSDGGFSGSLMADTVHFTEAGNDLAWDDLFLQIGVELATSNPGNGTIPPPILDELE